MLTTHIGKGHVHNHLIFNGCSHHLPGAVPGTGPCSHGKERLRLRQSRLLCLLRVLYACTKMTGSDAVFLGQYRGFSLTLSYDGMKNEYRMTMKGTLSHTVVLGADVFGNITRMDNLLDSFGDKLKNARGELAETQAQLENARAELALPFAREEELAEKTARLKELNILLNMDQKDKSLIDDGPEEDAPEQPKSRGYER